MKTIFKLAVGAAIAGALVNLLMKQRARAAGDENRAFDDSVGVGGGAKAEPVPSAPEASAATEDWHATQAVEPSRH